MKLNNIVTEGGFDPYVILNKHGIITNRATKIQAISFARNKNGVYAVPDKPKVLKMAQKLIKTMSGAKLKDAMFDLRFEGKLTEASSPGYEDRKFGTPLPTLASVQAEYEAKQSTKLTDMVNEAGNYKDVSNKFKNALDVMPEKYFNRKGVIALIKKLKEKRPDAAMAYAMDAFGWMPGMKEAHKPGHVASQDHKGDVDDLPPQDKGLDEAAPSAEKGLKTIPAVLSWDIEQFLKKQKDAKKLTKGSFTDLVKALHSRGFADRLNGANLRNFQAVAKKHIKEAAPKMKVYSWEKHFNAGQKELDKAANIMSIKSSGGYNNVKKDVMKVQKALNMLRSKMKSNSTEF